MANIRVKPPRPAAEPAPETAAETTEAPDLFDALNEFQQHTQDALVAVQDHLDAPVGAVAAPEVHEPEIVEELLPEHVRAEREVGRASVVAAQSRYDLEVEAGRRARELAEARSAAAQSE